MKLPWMLLWLCYSIIAPAQTLQAPAIQHAVRYQEPQDISAYWVSEKLDGVRGYWDGKQLFTRTGHLINAPSWFYANWPDTALDGELWLGRGKFEQISALLHRNEAAGENWQHVKFMIFDAPSVPGDFSERLLTMATLVQQSHSPYLQLIKQQKLASTTTLMALLDQVIAQQGEGLMLHHQHAYYHAGRNPLLMKLKKYQDEEATVIAYVPGKGKFTGMMGALTVQNSAGQIFNIGTGFNKSQRQHPPTIGSIITYKFFGKTANGMPRFASFMHERHDN